MSYVELHSLKQIEKDFGIEPNGVVQKFFTHSCRMHCDKYVPFDSGVLAGTISETASSFTYESPYASYQYYGERQDGTRKIKNRSYDKHALATSYWDKHMVTAESKELVDEVTQFMRGQL